MRINKLTDYGIVIMTRIAAMDSSRIYTAKELAKISKIPLPTVTRVLKTLSNENILVSQRGNQGGYGLTNSPSSISIASIIEAFEGPIALIDCANNESTCSYENGCCTQEPWQKINQTVRTSLDNIKLADMLQTNQNDRLVQLDIGPGVKA
tara:strand:- start:395 stop:847 length:453 start_codon:yes stop_codon:yes gene_type:complete